MAQLRVPTMLRAAAGGERVLTANGNTLRELLLNVEAQHPSLTPQVLDPSTRELRPFVNLYLNDEDVRYLKGLDTSVEEGDIISILPAVAGGSY